jgi:hypothetical protein
LAWFWSDDLARVMLEAGEASERQVRDWISLPVAVAGTADADPLEIARRLAGHAVESDQRSGAA